ncbi:hypothetical protein FB562_0196 [Homoserinimonas aerilata]|uniref:Uncharacterized protein n=1 Tax=Homoserinimonas aerilata TaxID=1162970 RepID=A0A542YGC4_9MICO|nr:hypothetical protein [Homoserinimonas aerilata]TQL47148.1 hypothetical protein FB562_0196 [Homoserinimonas aerilata]
MSAVSGAEPARRFGGFGVFVIVAGIVMALWVSFGRALFGVAGELTPVFAITIGFAIGALHFFGGKAIMRTARLGRHTRVQTYVTLGLSWFCGILFGFMIPDVTPSGLQTILSGGEEPGLSIAVGLANPLGIVCITASVFTLVFAHNDTREPVNEDDDEFVLD